MLSIFWFLVVLLIIWFCFYSCFTLDSDNEKFFGVAFGLSVILTIFSWNWIFLSWFNFIYSFMPNDNFFLMIGTAGLILFVVMSSFFALPPYIVSWCVEKKLKKKSKYYEEGKNDSIAGKQPQRNNTQYIAGYRDGITVSKKKEVDSYK